MRLRKHRYRRAPEERERGEHMEINLAEPDFSRGIMGEPRNASQALGNKVIDKSTKNCGTDADVATLDSPNGFDCNICLDITRDPVVTLCGHLYCWPCIYKWLQSHSGSQQCPVCKSNISLATLVPLYGRGQDDPSKLEGKGREPILDIPNRPPSAYSRAHTLSSQTTTLNELPNPDHDRLPHHHHHHHHHRSYYSDDYMSAPPHGFDLMMTHVIHPVNGSLGGLAMATLPWILGNRNVGLYYPNSFNLMGGGIDPWVRHQEYQARRMLSRILAFLSCFALLCFLAF